MEFHILEAMIAEWSRMTDRLHDAAEDTTLTPGYRELPKRTRENIVTIMRGRHELTAKARDAMRELRGALERSEGLEMAQTIGELSAGFAFQAHAVIQRRAASHDGDLVDRDKKAFDECREIARVLKSEI